MFDFNQDPEEVKRKISSIKDIFQKAANNSKTNAKPLFEKITNCFDSVLNIADNPVQPKNPIEALEAMRPLMHDFATSMQGLQQLAMRDMRVTMEMRTVVSEMQQVLLDNAAPSQDAPRTRPSAPKSSDAAKKGPGKGKFKF